MKVIVLGTSGMLGRYVYLYLKDKYETYQINRDNLDASNIDDIKLYDLFIKNNIERDDVVINCIGIIKQKNNISKLDFIKVNAVFPLALANVCEQLKCKLIHISTDCVFNGLDGKYKETDKHTAEDIYGKSKSLGESENMTCIRTSIIGEELNSRLSFIEWVKSNENKTVNGFINHFWNGITCLQFAKICEEIIEKNIFWNGVKHIYSNEIVTKAELIKIVSNAYDLNVKIQETTTPIKCDRSLLSVNPVLFKIPELFFQIFEQKNFLTTIK